MPGYMYRAIGPDGKEKKGNMLKGMHRRKRKNKET